VSTAKPTSKRPYRPSTTVATKCGFRCPDKTCIDHSLVCNGVKDCVYPLWDTIGADEKNCPTESPKCPGKFQCASSLKCIPLKSKCDGHEDCSDYSDEIGCPTKSISFKCTNFPFGFNCSDQEVCLSANERCNGVYECSDYSDESKNVCSVALKAQGLIATPVQDYVNLRWKAFKNVQGVLGYIIIYRSDNGHTGTIDPVRVLGFKYTYDIKGVFHGCSKYEIAFGVKMHALKMKDWLFSVVQVRTHANAESSRPSRLVYEQTIKANTGFLHWKEPEYCKPEAIQIMCTISDPKDSNKPLKSKTYKDFSGSSAELTDLIVGANYSCFLRVWLFAEDGKKQMDSDMIYFIPRSNAQPQIGHKKSSSNKTLVWAIPVALVVLVLIIALVVMVAKYRSLQRSFMAFANRGYTRAEEEDDDVAVTFHQGEDSAMINRFSDADPLVA